jgi:hypothetical protein
MACTVYEGAVFRMTLPASAALPAIWLQNPLTIHPPCAILGMQKDRCRIIPSLPRRNNINLTSERRKGPWHGWGVILFGALSYPGKS